MEIPVGIVTQVEESTEEVATEETEEVASEEVSATETEELAEA